MESMVDPCPKCGNKNSVSVLILSTEERGYFMMAICHSCQFKGRVNKFPDHWDYEAYQWQREEAETVEVDYNGLLRVLRGYCSSLKIDYHDKGCYVEFDTPKYDLELIALGEDLGFDVKISEPLSKISNYTYTFFASEKAPVQDQPI